MVQQDPNHLFHCDSTMSLNMHYVSYALAPFSLQDAMPTSSKANFSPRSTTSDTTHYLSFCYHRWTSLSKRFSGELCYSLAIIVEFWSGFETYEIIVVARFHSIATHTATHTHPTSTLPKLESAWKKKKKHSPAGPNHGAILGTFLELSERSPYTVKSLEMQLYL